MRTGHAKVGRHSRLSAPLGALGGAVWAKLRGLRVSWLQLSIVAAASAVALGFAHPVAPRAPTIRAAAETATTLFALAAAGLVRAQFIHTLQVKKLLLLAALLTLASTEFLGSVLPALLQARSGSWLTAAMPLGQLFVAATLAATAVTPPGKVTIGRNKPLVLAAALSVLATAVAESGGLLLRGQLLVRQASRDAAMDYAVWHPFGLIVLVGAAALFGFAAIVFARRARQEEDRIFSLFASAAVLLLAARLYYVAIPWASPETLTLREALRFVAAALILAAVIRRELEMRSAMTRLAAILERRRVAEDLHDGLAQDLAFIAASEARMAEKLGPRHPVVVAARRALAISRNTIGELSDTTSTSMQETLEVVAQEFRERFGIAIGVHVRSDKEWSPEAQDHVARITREAIANAAGHGHAQHVAVTLERANGWASLRVSDDGRGVHNGSLSPRPEGFGSRNMREHAEALGGSLATHTADNGGTELELIFS
jgi:signal transduction histidine kinase